MNRKRPLMDSPYKWLLLIPLLLGAAALAVPVGVLLDIIYMTFVQLAVFDRRGVFLNVSILYIFKPDSYWLWPLVWGVLAEIGITAAVFLTKEFVDRQEQRQKSPFRWLWLILIQLLCTVFMLFFGLFLDSRIHNADFWLKSVHNSIVRETGRGVPQFFFKEFYDYCVIYLPLAGVVFTVIVTVAAIILTVVERKKVHNKEDGRKANGLAKEG